MCLGASLVKKGCAGAMAVREGLSFSASGLPHLLTLSMGLGDLGFPHAKSSGTQLPGTVGKASDRQMGN